MYIYGWRKKVPGSGFKPQSFMVQSLHLLFSLSFLHPFLIGKNISTLAMWISSEIETSQLYEVGNAVIPAHCPPGVMPCLHH